MCVCMCLCASITKWKLNLISAALVEGSVEWHLELVIRNLQFTTPVSVAVSIYINLYLQLQQWRSNLQQLHCTCGLSFELKGLHIAHMFVCLYMLNYPAYVSATFSNYFKLPMKEIRENNAPIICHLFIIKSFAMTKKITTHSTNKDCVCVCLTRKQRRSSSLVGVRNGLIEDCVWQRNTSFVNGSTYRTNNLWPTSKI